MNVQQIDDALDNRPVEVGVEKYRDCIPQYGDCMKNRFSRLLLLLLTVGAIGFGLVSTLHFTASPTSDLAQSVPLKLKPAVDKLAKISFVRHAAAAELDSNADTAADKRFGQPDFSTGTAPTAPTADTLNQPGDLFVYDRTGQIFIADTAHNRVLIWDSVDLYENGDPANVVLGQPDFLTADVLDPPTAADMNAPRGITVGFDGLIYVSDTGNNRVLVFFPVNYDDEFIPGESWPIYESGMDATYVLGQINLTSNVARPTAGDTLSRPNAIVTDVNDNLVVADTGNNRVTIFTWPLYDGKSASFILGQEGDNPFANAAPNPPTRRSMNAPTGLAVGTTAGELYVADTGNNRILVYTDDPLDSEADGIIGQPDYVSNSPNHSGVGATGLNHPTGLKMDAGSRLFVADSHNHRVLVFDRTTSDVTADAVFGQDDFSGGAPNSGGISASSLYTPTSIATDALFMDVYIADSGNHRVLQYDQPLENPAPVIAELDPGTVPPGLTDFSFLEYGKQGSFTLAIWGSGIISDTVIEVNGVPRATGTNFLGLAFADIQAADVANSGVLTVTLRNPAPGGGVSAPFALQIYEPQPGDEVADNVLGQQSFTSDHGPWIPTANDNIFDPSGLVVDRESGRVFLADTGNARVLSWSSSEAQNNGGNADLVLGKPNFETYFFNESAGISLIRPVGLALDSQGNLYVSDASEGMVLVYTKPFTNGMPSALIINGLNNPVALALDSQDNLYVADTHNHRVLLYEKPLADNDTIPDHVFGQPDLNGVAPNAGGAISAQSLDYPSGVALDTADNLYVADSNNHRVLVFLNPLGSDSTADAVADVVFGQGGDFTTGVVNKGGVSAESLNFPYGLLVDEKGNLYVADMDNNRVLGYVDPLNTDEVADLVLGQDGSFARNQVNQGRSAAAGSTPRGPGTFYAPITIGLNADGDLFVTDNRNNRVLSFRGPLTLSAESKLYLPNVKR
ncbi:hypothetical protein GC175_31845 [bacterium]|nr:hypothetical protein [bacterium]